MNKFKNVWVIIKKEFKRFFQDKRLRTALFLPGLLIYVIYSFIGDGMLSSLGEVEENYVYTMYAVNAPIELEMEFALLQAQGFEISPISPSEADEIKEKIKNKEADILVVFPTDFSLTGNGESLSNIDVYYNSIKTESAMAYSLTTAIFSGKQYGEPNFLMPTNDLSTEEDVVGMMFSMIGPMLIMVFLFSGCMSIAPESIAGEKERGTFATMLVTPVKRSHIALGKIIALSALSLMSGVCSFLGVMLSLPKLMGSESGMQINASVYTAGDYLMLLGVVLSTVLLMVSAVSVISALAKSVKEAAGMVAPMTMVVMILGALPMLTNSANAWYFHLIPLYNSATAIASVFSFTIQPLNVMITIVVNLVCVVGFSALLAKMFDSEKIM